MKLHQIASVLMSVIYLSSTALAQEDARRIKVDVRRPLRLDYQSGAWNKDANKVETSVLLIRDSKSGRLAKVEVTENGRDTGLFIGFYQLNFEATTSQEFEMTPEIYLVPPQLANGAKGLATVADMIRDGQLLRKPYFLRIENRSVQAISVYDTKDQALDAYQGFLKTGSGRQIVDRAAMAAAQAAKQSAEARARIEAEAKAEADRARMAADEATRIEAARKKAAEMDANAKALRKAKGKTFADEAMELYKAEKYAEAAKKFQQASDLDPENQGYYFQYGVTLYKIDDYQRSLVLLDQVKEGVKGSDVNMAEVEYYRGLNHLKLKEYNGAYKSFLDVKNRNDATLSPVAGFFAGVIDFQNENLDSAKNLFEYVMDQSKDPKLDQQSEAYLDQIANIRQYQEMQKKKFFVNANLGLMYDSNILSMSAANAPTDLAGWRWAYGGSLEYRPLFTPKHELSMSLAINDMYSQDKSFKSKTEFQNTDPLMAVFAVPYRFKSELFSKGYQLTLTPSFQNIQMNADGEGSRETILSSSVLALEQTFVMSEDWFSTYTLEGRRDNSLITSTADESQSATKVTLTSTQSWFYDSKKTKAFLWDFGYAMNNAEGINQKYNRIDCAFTYLAPVTETWSGTARFAYYNSNYNQHQTGRTDNNFGLTLAGRRPIEKLLFFNLALTYNKNNSIEAYTYDKFSILTSVSWDQNF